MSTEKACCFPVKAQPGKPVFAVPTPDGNLTYYQIASPNTKSDFLDYSSQVPKGNNTAVLSAAGVQESGLIFYINGKKHVVYDTDPRTTLNDYLRTSYGLTGTKKVCGEGGCGACTVMLTWFDYNSNQEVNASINSCLAPLYTIDGKSVTTVEGLGNAKDGYSSVQQQLASCNGSQCGFCSPGWVVQMHSLLKNNPNPTEKMVEDHFDGNLCRCTGYRPILDAFKSFASDYNIEKSRCKVQGKLKDIEDICLIPTDSRSKSNAEIKNFLRQSALKPRNVRLTQNNRQWFHPISLSAVYSLIVQFQNSIRKLVVGNTSIGIYKDTADAEVFIYIRDVQELNRTSISSSSVTIGSAITISKLIEFLEQVYQANSSNYKVLTFPAIIKHLYRVANFQVRNSASWAGNIMLAQKNENFPSDIYTIMMGAGVTVTVGDAFTGQTTNYDLTSLLQINLDTKVLISMTIPFATSANQHLKTYKVSQRHENAHAFVNASLNMTVDPTSLVVQSQPILAFGGIGPHVVRATQTEQYLVGKTLNQSTLNGACSTLSAELIPNQEPGYLNYRSQLPLSFFYKFFLSLLPSIPKSLQSAAQSYDRPVSSGQITYDTDPIEYPVSEFMPKIDSILQTSGEAHYCDDTPIINGTLWAAFVTSTEANAQISSIDISVALSMPGVVDWVSASDIPGENNCDTVDGVPALYAEPVFADPTVNYYGQPIGLIIADSQAHAHEAAKCVIVKYTSIQTPILTLPQALQAGSFFPETPTLKVSPIVSGDVETGFAQSDHVFEGVVEAPAQYHFHMESHQCVVAPEEDGRLTMHISTQWPAKVQQIISRVLGMPDSRITVGLKRVGGSYGAKILRSCIIGAAASVAAHKLNRPIRLIMDLNTNMEMQGKRHPYLATYKIGVQNSGKVQAIELMYYCNGGANYGANYGSTNMALTTADNTYYFPNFSANAKICRTNLPPNTYMRAPGCLPAIFFMESIMITTAQRMNMNVDDFRSMNFYQEGQVTPYGSKLTYWNIPTIWQQIQQSNDYQARVQAVNTYNSTNRWTKKGISLVPCKYGIEWAFQGFGAILNVFPDATVQLSHSGCEIGQGINTKVAQVLALELGCDISLITVTSTNSQKMPNGSTTGGSITSELCSQAVIGAARKFNERLKPLRKLLPPNTTWSELITLATTAGLDMQSRYWTLNTPPSDGGPFQYNCYGAAISETRVDVLTGEVQIERVDILYDCGTSLNPAVDIGQVEGGFVQGIGYFLTERLLYDTNGKLTTNGTWEYKPPSTKDIPIDFRTSLLSDAPNPNGVLSSKASGEPPMTLSCGVYFAVKQAIENARSAAGLHPEVFVSVPATPDVIQTSCAVTASQFTIS